MKKLLVPLVLAGGVASVGFVLWTVFASDEGAVLIDALDAEDWWDDDDEDDDSSAPVASLSSVELFDVLAALELEANGRDPFRPLGEDANDGSAAAAARVVRLTGTLAGRERRVAWIGDLPVGVGDVFEGWRVSRIERGWIVVEDAGESREVAIGGVVSSSVPDRVEPAGGDLGDD